MAKKRAFKLTPPDPDEDQLQASVANLFDAILPEELVAWSHFPAGGYELSPAARARLYRLGLKRGWPDLLLCYGQGDSLWLEVKTRTGNLSPAQRAMHLRLRSLGHHVVVVRRIEDVIAALIEYRVPFRQTRIDGSYLHGPQINQSNAPVGAQEPAQSPA